jgi:hypothetical protein
MRGKKKHNISVRACARGWPFVRATGMSSIKDAFRGAFTEISRRATVASAHDANAPTFFPACDASFDTSVQSHILVSMGTDVLAPRPADPCRPALRVYGGFPSRADAVEHAEVVREIDATCSLVIVPRDEWALMPGTMASRDDAAERRRRVDAVVARADAARAAQCEVFDERVRTHDADTTPVRVAEHDTETQDAEEEVYGHPRRLRAGAEVRGQGAVALVVVPDPEGECAIRVLGCFETTSDADAWVQGVASRRMVDHDIVVAPTCEWLYPNGGTVESGRRRYRVDELQRIMDTADRNPEAVRTYKEWRREKEAREAEAEAEENKAEENKAEAYTEAEAEENKAEAPTDDSSESTHHTPTAAQPTPLG